MKKHRKKIISAIIILALIITCIPYKFEYVKAESEVERIKKQISSTYKEALNRSGRKSFNGYCASYVQYQLSILGITNKVESGYNGNGAYEKFSGSSKTSGDYYIIKYSGSDAINKLVDNNEGTNIYNILVGFQTSPTSAGKTYGHVLFIHAIINGYVYYSESFSGSGIAEGACRVKSIANFIKAYSKSGYKWDGAIHFTKANSYSITDIYDSDVTRDSMTFNLKMKQKSPIEKVGVFYGTSKSKVEKITTATLHKGTDDYNYYLLMYNAKAPSISSYSFNTKKKTHNEWNIKLSAGTKYYYKMVVKINKVWYISKTDDFTMKNDKPSAVTNLTVSDSTKKVGKKTGATIKWKKSNYATSYKITVKNSSGIIYATKTISDGSAVSYTTGAISTPGTYTVSVVASNSSGDSSATSVNYEVMDDVTLTFDSNSDISTQESKIFEYKGSITTPSTPKRTGYTFEGWENQTTGELIGSSTKITGVTESVTYKAKWTPNKYTIKLIDGVSNEVIKEEKVAFDETITMDEFVNAENVPEHKNYTFVGWSEDEYTVNSTEEHSIYARYKWDSDVQVATTIESVKRASSDVSGINATSDGYSIDINVSCPSIENGATKTIKGRVVVVLKTNAGRLLIETESSAFVLYPQNGTESSKLINVFVPYEATAKDALASVVEVYVVNNYYSAGLISDVVIDKDKIADANADEWNYTSDSSILNRDDVINGTEKDNFVTYDLTTITTKDSLNSSMSGYTLASSKWSDIVESGSQELVKNWPSIGNKIGSQFNNASGAGASIYERYYKPESQWIKDSEDSSYKYETKDTLIDYIYYHWCVNRNNGNLDHNVTLNKYYSEASGNKYYTFHCHSLSPTSNTLNKYFCSLSNLQKNVYKYDTSDLSKKDWRDVCKDSHFWVGRIPAYRRDWTVKRKIYTYTNSVTKEGIVVDDIDSVPKNTSTGLVQIGSYYSGKLKLYQNVDTQISNVVQWYAYKTKVEVTHEDKNKISDIPNDRIQYNNLSKYAGEKVTVYIYKNDEMSDFNTEYMGIKTIDEKGNIDLSDIQLREECSKKTGDFTIAVALPGETNAIVIGKIEAPKSIYTVTFNAETSVNNDGTIETVEIDTQNIVEGENAILPDQSLIPEKEGYHFVGWSQSTVGVNDNLTVSAIYEKNEYTIVYVDWENRSIDMKKYKYMDQLDIPALPDTEEGIDVSWVIGDGTDENSITLEEYVEDGNVVTSDMIVSTKYEYETYVVNILNCSKPNEIEVKVQEDEDVEHLINDYSIASDSLEYGDIIQLEQYEEALLEDENIIFYGWKNAATGEYISDIEVTDEITIYPEYEYAETVDIPIADVVTGEYSESQTVSLTTETDNAVIYYTTDGSDPSKSDSAIEYTGPISVTKSCTLKAYACAMGMNDSGTIVELYAINTDTSGTPYHIVTVYLDSDGANNEFYQVLQKDSILLDISNFEEIEGYDFESLYLDKLMIEEFDASTEVITESMTLYANYIPKTYTVQFVDTDGNIISEQSINYGEAAVEPTAPELEGYVFVGWDNDEYECVTEDIVCTASYVLESEYATVSLNKSKVTMMEGMDYTKLKATISPIELSDTEVEWTSSDWSVVSVDNEGIVTAEAPGVATITVTVISTGEIAECVFKVVGNYQTSIVLSENSEFGIDSEGYIREIKEENNTVEYVLSQFNNEVETMKIYDKEGNELTNEDLVGTGSVIKLISDGEVIDTMTVVMTGDIDGDGHVGNIDVSKISKWLIQTEELTYEQQLASDVNGDGYVNNKDASVVSRYLVGKENL